MRIIIRNSILFFLLFMVIILATTDIIQKSNLYNTIFNFFDEEKQGRITIKNVDDVTGRPIKNTEYLIIENGTNKMVDIVKTDLYGKGLSKLLDYNKSYIIQQTLIDNPYVKNDAVYKVEIDQGMEKVTLKNNMPKYIKEYEIDQHNEIHITEVKIDVEVLKQKPELPNGCEVTALTSTLNFYGYDVTKTKIADEFLPKKLFESRNGKLFGPDPYKFYGGNPRSLNKGFYAYPPPVAKAANEYLDFIGGKSRALNISGSTKGEIIDILNKGIPVITWVTIDLQKPKKGKSWHFFGENKLYKSLSNSHTVVVTGYNNKGLYVMDPLIGNVLYDTDKFFANYNITGQHAMIIIE
ncbi:C39 family peptidase [Virgibacillus sp. DJP39]|uniref:C39 family peptidase n=1 Tax=Virgibacillus sp. DJP39 TaxID=3409790 RepID=UPI003BB79312